MKRQSIDLSVVCVACKGTGLYVGLAERDGTAVVCAKCKGTGNYAYRYEYEPFVERRQPPRKIKSVHVNRGYVISHGYEGSDGGLPIKQWQPGMTVPADEKLYCPWNYTTQEWCAHRDKDGYAPFPLGQTAQTCPYWDSKAECWTRFYTDAPEKARRQIT